MNGHNFAAIWHNICQSLFKLKFCANFLPPVREKTCPAKLRLSPFAAVWPILTFVQCSLPTGSHLCSAWCHFCAEDEATEFSHLSPKRLWYCAKGRVGGVCALQRWIVMMTWHWQLCTVSKTILPKDWMKVHQIMMMNMTTAVKGSFYSVVRCQPLLCRRLTPSRPHLHWLASTLNY